MAKRRTVCERVGRLLLMLSLTGFAAQTLGWNSDGHRIVAQIAASELGDESRLQIERLFGQPALDVLVAQSSWADAIAGERQDTRPWHYVNIPRRAEGFDWLRDCPGGACVIGALKVQFARLRSSDESDAARREALAFVVHLVADLHQPLHCGDGGDRGGNDIAVTVDGVRTNLHRVWDGEFFPWRQWTAQDLPVASFEQDESDIVDASVVVTWAEQSHRIAVDHVYATLPAAGADRMVVIGLDQLERDWPLARQRVQLAGRRLARLLDAAFMRP